MIRERATEKSEEELKEKAQSENKPLAGSYEPSIEFTLSTCPGVVEGGGCSLPVCGWPGVYGEH